MMQLYTESTGYRTHRKRQLAQLCMHLHHLPVNTQACSECGRTIRGEHCTLTSYAPNASACTERRTVYHCAHCAHILHHLGWNWILHHLGSQLEYLASKADNKPSAFALERLWVGINGQWQRFDGPGLMPLPKLQPHP